MSGAPRLLVDCGCILGEGPLWHHLRQELFFFDIKSLALFAASLDGEVIGRWDFEQPVSAAAIIDADRLLIASAGALWHLNLSTGDRREVLPLEADRPENRSNDGGTNPAGGFWIGTMRNDEGDGGGAVYQYRLGVLEKILDRVSIPNSICFSPDGRTGYFADTPTNRILKCEIEAETGLPRGEWSLFTEIDRGSPDGATIDSEGYLWSARWGGACVVRHAPDGRIDRVVEMPVDNVTCPAFGGPDLQTLFLTTARHGLSPEQEAAQKQAGGVFAIDVAVPGLAKPLLAL